MIGLFAELPLVFAQDGGSGSIWSILLPLAPIPLIFYYFLIRPQQQQEQKRRSMLDGLKKHDQVVTTGGVYGTVISIDPKNDRVVLRVDDERGVKMAFTRASVARVTDASSEKPGEST